MRPIHSALSATPQGKIIRRPFVTVASPSKFPFFLAFHAVPVVVPGHRLIFGGGVGGTQKKMGAHRTR